MGIGNLWHKLGPAGTVENIADYAAKHFKEHRRPLRIAVDEPGWRYKNVSQRRSKEIQAESETHSNPVEKNILSRILRLLPLGIQLHFVFDGPDRPTKRGSVRTPLEDSAPTALFKKMLTVIGIPYHSAPGEAEADCAEMQRLGIVDAVWSEDGDAFMFGCQVLIRNHYEKQNKKRERSNTHVQVYKMEDIVRQVGLDREGFVLHAVLSGGDYNEVGLRDFGPVSSILAAQQGLGKTLCGLSESRLPQWRQELIQHLKNVGNPVKVPEKFPLYEHVKDYRAPLLSESRRLECQRGKWDKGVHVVNMQVFLQEKFYFDAKKHVELVAPMLLVRSLLRTSPSQEGDNDRFKLELDVHQDPKVLKVTYLLREAAPLDMSLFGRQKEGDAYGSGSRVSCEIQKWILEYAIPEAVADTYAIIVNKPIQPTLDHWLKRAAPSEGAERNTQNPAKRRKGLIFPTASKPTQRRRPLETKSGNRNTRVSNKQARQTSINRLPNTPKISKPGSSPQENKSYMAFSSPSPSDEEEFLSLCNSASVNVPANMYVPQRGLVPGTPTPSSQPQGPPGHGLR